MQKCPVHPLLLHWWKMDVKYIKISLTVIHPKPFIDFFNKNLVGSTQPELIEKGTSAYIQITITKDSVDAICALTTNQTSSKYWQRNRAFRVTVSIFKRVAKTSPEHISHSFF